MLAVLLGGRKAVPPRQNGLVIRLHPPQHVPNAWPLHQRHQRDRSSGVWRRVHCLRNFGRELSALLPVPLHPAVRGDAPQKGFELVLGHHPDTKARVGLEHIKRYLETGLHGPFQEAS